MCGSAPQSGAVPSQAFVTPSKLFSSPLSVAGLAYTRKDPTDST